MFQFAGKSDEDLTTETECRRHKHTDVPKTLIFAEDGAHTDDIVRTVREELGKTFTAISLIYRLIRHADAKRILFLFDRANFGVQTYKEFQHGVDTYGVDASSRVFVRAEAPHRTGERQHRRNSLTVLHLPGGSIMSQSKSKKDRPKRRVPPQGTIELRQSAEGNMYFSGPIGDEHRTWRVHPEGVKLLADYGYTVGMKIPGSTANYMRQLDLVYTLKPAPKKPAAGKPDPLQQLFHSARDFDKRWTEDNERYPALMEEKRSQGKGSPKD